MESKNIASTLYDLCKGHEALGEVLQKMMALIALNTFGDTEMMLLGDVKEPKRKSLLQCIYGWAWKITQLVEQLADGDTKRMTQLATIKDALKDEPARTFGYGENEHLVRQLLAAEALLVFYFGKFHKLISKGAHEIREGQND